LAATLLNSASIISRNSLFAGNTRCDHMPGIPARGSEAVHVSADAGNSAMKRVTFVNFTAVSWRIVAIGKFQIAIDDLASLIDTTEIGVAATWGRGYAIRSDRAARN